MMLRDEFKAISGAALRAIDNPLIPSPVRHVIGALFVLLGKMIDRIETLERKIDEPRND